VHIAMVVVFSIAGISVLFWLLWSLLVFGGGIQAKLLPAFQLITHTKTLSAFGYVGYPYAMGVFEGWPTNLVALVVCMVLVAVVWFTMKDTTERK
jgi:hypothetical protein